MSRQVVTFLFTDIVGSTRRWEADPDGMQAALAAHDDLLRSVITGGRGTVFKHTGDGCAAAFDDPVDAARAAIEAQRKLLAGDGGGLQVRMAVHTGAADGRDGDWFGPPLNRCARMVAIAQPGQVLLSDATANVVAAAGMTLVDLGEQALRDLAQPERIWQVVAPGLPRDFPPLAPGRTRGNLPRARTSLVGRDEAIERVGALLDDSPIVTLTGVGGCGKTRLAVAIARERADRHRDGAWFVDLAPIADPNLVAHSIAAAIAMPRAIDPRRELGSYLADRQMLLVVDNCEHLLDECAAIVDELIEIAPDVQVLATSREPLDVDGERIFRVPSLDPEDEGLTLFEMRARAARNDFRVDDASRPAVVQLCTALDGIPLAIELAAAQVAAFSPAEILDLLDQRLTLLTGGRRRGRQATLAAVVEWSHALLDDAERRALRRAAVLPGSFGLDAFAAVVDCDHAEASRLVRDLVQKSLLELAGTDGVARYRMLETVRLYGEQELATIDDASAARDRLATWVLGMLQSTPPGSPVADVVRRETDAIRAALTWMEADGRIVDLGELATTAGWGWARSLHLDDLRRWIDVLEAADDRLPPRQQVAWRTLRAAAAMGLGDGVAMFEWSSAALAIDPGHDNEWHPFARLMHAIVLQYIDPPAARVVLEQGRGTSDNPLVESSYDMFIALQPMVEGDPIGSIDLLDAAAQSSRERGERWTETVALVGRATALDLAGRHEEALTLASRLLDVVDEELDWIDELIIVMAVAIPTARLGDLDGAREHLRRMLDACRRRYAHIPTAVGVPIVTAGVLLRMAGDAGTAAHVLQSACTTMLAARSEMAWATARHELAEMRALGVEHPAGSLDVAELVAITESVAQPA